jgi:hypothetical protein
MKLVSAGVLAFVVTMGGSLRAQQADCSVAKSGFPIMNQTNICMIPHGFPSTSALERAAELWNATCEAGETTPYICVGNSGSCLQIDVFYSAGNSSLPQGKLRFLCRLR